MRSDEAFFENQVGNIMSVPLKEIVLEARNNVTMLIILDWTKTYYLSRSNKRELKRLNFVHRRRSYIKKSMDGLI